MFRKVTLVGMVLAFAVIMLDAVGRFSGAPLACPNWPLCHAQQFFPDVSQLEGGDVINVLKALAYRYVYGLLGGAIIVMALLSAGQKNHRLMAVSGSLCLLLCVSLQAAAQFWIAQSQAMPVIVTGNTLLTLISFWLLFGLFLRSQAHLPLLMEPLPVWSCRVASLVLFLQIALGVWVSANHAGLVCVGFPQCNGQWLPPADYQNGLNVLSGLLAGYAGDLAYSAQEAINVLHRWGAVACFVILTLVIWGSLAANQPKPVRTAGLWLSLMIFIEIALGIAGFKLAMPEWVAVAHHAVASLMMLPLLAITFYRRYGVAKTFSEAETTVGEPLAEGATAAPSAEAAPQAPAESLLLRLKNQLYRTRSGLGGVLANLALGSKAIDKDLLEELESRLLMADIGINVTTDIIANLTQKLERHQLGDATALSTALKEELLSIVKPCDRPLLIPKQDGPFVILVVGVNGAGKTTTIGKLAKRLQGQGHSVMLAAGDTFRAAAVEQLQTWGERNHIPVVAQHTGADSASVIYDGIQSAQAKGIDVLIADTAGRLHTKSNLMDELKKVKRIMAKLDASAPHEVLLVLDAGTGQNALSQAKLFNEAVELTGLVLTKLDGTAKGGVIFALAKQSGIPIRFIGIGEGIDDLQDFNADNFIDALFAND